VNTSLHVTAVGNSSADSTALQVLL